MAQPNQVNFYKLQISETSGTSSITLVLTAIVNHPTLINSGSPTVTVRITGVRSRFLQRNKETTTYMRGTAALSRAKNTFNNINPVKPSWVATLTPKKVKDDGFEKTQEMKKEEVDPIVTFSKPPPVPPVLGPLVLLSLWETWSTRDDN
ncbi:hypothetical protein Hdeb2414_s0001g00007331 [Helianthus debilis subsp. tardiflorus]